MKHPAIAKMLDCGIDTGVYFAVFEYVPGRPLRDHMALGRPFPLVTVQRIVAPLAEALDYAHAQQVLHLDLKPENVRVTESFDFRIVDLGFTKDFRPDSKWEFFGTPAYTSPEQARGQPSDGRSDQYALATMAYQLLTGHLPFDRSPLRRMNLPDPLSGKAS